MLLDVTIENSLLEMLVQHPFVERVLVDHRHAIGGLDQQVTVMDLDATDPAAGGHGPA